MHILWITLESPMWSLLTVMLSWASSWPFCCVVATGPERYRNEHVTSKI